MPVYEFRCEACGEQFELFVRSIARSGAPECPKCGSDQVAKAVSLCGASSSGSGRSTGPSCDTGFT